MPLQKFLIAPFNSGLQRDVRPWLIPEDAFQTLKNAYNFRGRIRKRIGSRLLTSSTTDIPDQLISRLRINIGTTNAVTGNFAAILPGFPNFVGQKIAVVLGATVEEFTVITLGAAALLASGAGTGTLNTANGALVLTGSLLAGTVFYYPDNPVMGISNIETVLINDEPTIAWDTQFAYQWNNGWFRLGALPPTANIDIWTGSNSQFFWADNYIGLTNDSRNLYVVNNNAADGLRRWNGATWFNLSVGAPPITATNAAGNNFITTARIVLAFKDRLVLLAPQESIAGAPSTLPQRCRFSQNGSPSVANAWRDDIAGRGGFIDAPTTESIITASFLKDRLIVYFERSTWELVYTGNEILPFRWQQINTELGAESTFSVISFDKIILGVGDVGIHACNGANVERIDQKIPDEVFGFNNENAGKERIAGIRDFLLEVAYWAYVNPEIDTNIFPNKILLYNYLNATWAIFDDSITAFGYIQNQEDITWGESDMNWEDANETWGGPTLEAGFKQVLAGNQEGFTFVMDGEANKNARALQITDIAVAAFLVTLTIINHNLQTGDFIFIEGSGIPELDNNIFVVVPTAADPANEVALFTTAIIATPYLGRGYCSLVSKIDIKTKEFNFFTKEGLKSLIPKVYYYVTRTANGEIATEFLVDSSFYDMGNQGSQSGSLLGNLILETTPFPTIPLEASQTRLWHPLYYNAEGSTVQFRLFFNDQQMEVNDVVFSDFELHAILIYASPTSDFL